MGVLTLFGSSSTLFCCALPTMLAAIAGGSVAVTMLSAFPWMMPLARYKEWMFLAAGILIGANGILTLGPQGRLACALTGGKGCEVAGNFSKTAFWVSLGIYSLGAFFAYAALPILRLLG